MEALFQALIRPLIRNAYYLPADRTGVMHSHHLLTTHSEWMLEALANLVRLSELPETERRAMTGADVALAPHQVGAWRFKPSADGTGSTVEEISLDTEAGNYPAGFGDVTESLYNEWVGISNRIETGQADQSE